MPQKSKRKILVSGSVVLDVILSKTLSQANGEKEFFGGTGANIAYGLGKLKTNPLLFSLVGEDFKKNFKPHLQKNGVDLRVHIEKSGKTASFVCDVPDEKGKQEGIWNPNVYKKIEEIALVKKIKPSELKKVSIAIFSPGTPRSTEKHLREFKNFSQNALSIFDPGQMINTYSKKQLINCINLCDLFIVNELEYAQTKRILGKDSKKIFENKTVIKTLGNKGSVILKKNNIIKIRAVHPKKVVDTTGAGDAYRAGLIFGLWKGLPLSRACNLGAKTASKNIEYLGCQKY